MRFTFEQLEEMTVAFLKEHDAYYKSTKKNKKQIEEYSYDTEIQAERKRRAERTFSNLTVKDTTNCLRFGVDKTLLPQYE